LGVVVLLTNGGAIRDSQAYQSVKVEGRQLLLDDDRDGVYDPFVVKGIGYSNTPIGTFPSEWGLCRYTETVNEKPQFVCPGVKEFDDEAVLERDFPLIKAMNANTVRTWGEVTAVFLEKANRYGLKVIAGFWVPYNLDYIRGDLSKVRKDFLNYVARFKEDPSILMWGLSYQNALEVCSFPDAGPACDRKEQTKAFYRFVNDLAQEAKAIEGESFHPIMIVSADLGDIGYLASDEVLSHIDVHGCAVYRGREASVDEGFFYEYTQRSQKPVLVVEFGTDAWYMAQRKSPEQGQERQDIQATYLAASWDIIMEHLVANGGPAIGGVISSYADAWWKYQGEWKASAATHEMDHVSNWFTGPDGLFSPEWSGIMALAASHVAGHPDQIIPRVAYRVMQQKFTAQVKQRPWQLLSQENFQINIPWYYTLGYHFTPQKDGVITHLGGNFSGEKAVSLWDRQTGEVLAHVSVKADGRWYYAPINPINVKAGRTYTVAAFMEGNGASHRYAKDFFPRRFGDIIINGSTFIYGNDRPTEMITHHCYGHVDICFVPHSPAVNKSPTIVEHLTASPQILEDDQTTVLLQVKAADGDDQELFYEWFVTQGRVEGTGDRVTYHLPSVSTHLPHTVAVFITDGRGGWVMDHAILNVK
jgi:hypothetical protein